MIRNSRAKKISVMALLSAISLVLAAASRYLALPFLPILKIDASDIPIFMSTAFFGASSGALILFIVSLLRTLFFSTAGWPGFCMRMSTLVPVFLLALYCKKDKKNIFYLILIIIISLICKVSLCYFFWIHIYLMSDEFIKSIMCPIVVPYNIIKLSVSIIVALLICKKIKHNPFRNI